MKKAPIEEVYVPAAIQFHPSSFSSLQGSEKKCQQEKGDKINNEILLQNYKDMFCSEGKAAKNIHIVGEAGSGKSTFSTKIVHDWCKAVTESAVNKGEGDKYFLDVEFLKSFKFVFFISLGEAGHGVCNVDAMVHHVLITWGLDSQKYTPEILSQCLTDESTLFILDGLDEWTHSTVNPHRNTSTQCTYLVFTRTWQMSRLKKSDIDVLFDITGVIDIEKLLNKAADYFDKKCHTHREISDFIGRTSQVRQLLQIPAIAMHLFYIWYEYESLAESKTKLYSEILDMLLIRADISDTDTAMDNVLSSSSVPSSFGNKTSFVSNKSLLSSLGKLAFLSLFLKPEYLNKFLYILVEIFLSNENKMKALQNGILTQHEVQERSNTAFCFLHRTIQKFLAVFYIATQAVDSGT